MGSELSVQCTLCGSKIVPEYYCSCRPDGRDYWRDRCKAAEEVMRTTCDNPIYNKEDYDNWKDAIAAYEAAVKGGK